MFRHITFALALMVATPQEPDVILVTIDGTRWQEVFNGTDHWRDHGHHLTSRQLLPNLYNYFVDDGIAVGKLTPIIASGPNHISLPGYLEITRGHSSTDCQSNYCQPVIDQSVFWFFQSPAVFSSWITIGRTVPAVSNTYRDNGTDWYRLDNETELATITYLQDHTPDFLWVALGDTDEFAHQNDYNRYLDSLKTADSFIGYLVHRYPNSTIIVTADHGRNADFKDHGTAKESERVWLMMRGQTVPHDGFVSAAPLSLSNILPTITDVEFGGHSPKSILSLIKK
jgi:Metalloenzyme superfamily